MKENDLRALIGSPVGIADDMEKWFRRYGVDGFLMHPAYPPGGLDDFVELVVPELQSRGLFRASMRARPCARI
jgi:N-acetyl-S-(2-succino)cysteine monooxygenase